MRRFREVKQHIEGVEKISLSDSELMEMFNPSKFNGLGITKSSQSQSAEDELLMKEFDPSRFSI